MSKLHFKGGPWTNAEDQVLKAALAQYGLRDWERVASMLTKKTAAQCRERWENYLDPRLNIREAWSLEEEEKLVELQSLFPNKFRLIAEQLTRRTPTHYIRPAWLCEQRYLELKDEQEQYAKQQQQQQQGQEETDEAAKQSLEAFMAERRRRRNARKTHEERAARADTVSGERFQQEMVDMATSRLANQDQKKGLRKERQRQLEEAAFLAKLESNREGIESGTLSLRQSKKMRKALEEDRRSIGIVDTVAENDEDNDSDDNSNERKAGKGGRVPSDESDFEAIDMYEDQQQAGLVKRQRVLMKDLTEQQRIIQQRQIQSGGDGKGGESSDGSRARAALTGVNHDLLRQLTAGPSRKTSSSTTTTNSASAAFLRDRPSSGTTDTAADTQSELKSTLSDLFAALPQAASASAGSGAIPPPLPLPPPAKRPRESLPSISAEGVPLLVSSSSYKNTSTSGDSVPDDLLSALNSVPAPRKHAKTEVDGQVSEKPLGGDTDADARPLLPSAISPGPPTEVEPAVQGDSAAIAVATFRTAEEANTYLAAARRWVAVECEKAVTAAYHSRKGEPGVGDAGTAASSLALSPADKEAAEKLIESEMRSNSERSQVEAVRAVREYVNDEPRYTVRVDVQNALHQLSSRVAAQVREANAVLQPLRQQWEQIVAVAMLQPRQLHALQGYVRDDGQLKQPSAYVEGEGNSERGAPSSMVIPSVAAYVYEHLVNELTQARQATRFIASLREREQLAMRRDLDAAEHALQQLQAREKTLQGMYRQKRVQQ